MFLKENFLFLKFWFFSSYYALSCLFVYLFISPLYWVIIQRGILSIPLFFHMAQSCIMYLSIKALKVGGMGFTCAQRNDKNQKILP